MVFTVLFIRIDIWSHMESTCMTHHFTTRAGLEPIEIKYAILIFDVGIVPNCVLFSVFDFIRSVIHFPGLSFILIYSYIDCKER